jgi:hypothetical protein
MTTTTSLPHEFTTEEFAANGILSHALLAVTGFPVIYSAAALVAVGSFLLVTLVAAAIIAIPGYRAARVAPYPWSTA